VIQTTEKTQQTEADDEEKGEDLGDLLLEVLPGEGTTIDVSRKKRLMT